MEVVLASFAPLTKEGFSSLGKIRVKMYIHVNTANHGIFPWPLLIKKVTRMALGRAHTSARLNSLCFVFH